MYSNYLKFSTIFTLLISYFLFLISSLSASGILYLEKSSFSSINQVVSTSITTLTTPTEHSTITYDNLNRLRSKKSIQENIVSAHYNYQYNLNSQPIQLDRSQLINTNDTIATLFDSLNYTYQQTELLKVKDNSNHPKGYNSSPTTSSTSFFKYDANGNMISDGTNSKQIEYNAVNQVSKVNYNTGCRIEFTYSSDTQLSAKHIYIHNNLVYSTYYNGNYEYTVNSQGDITNLSKHDSLTYWTPQGIKMIIKDRLGSNTMLLSDLNSNHILDTSELQQEQTYTPYGIPWTRATSTQHSTENSRLFHNRPYIKDSTLNWYHYDARMYNPILANWLSIDPHAEEYTAFATNSAFIGNPTNVLDPDGRDIILLFAPRGAGGLGHVGILVGDAKSGYTYFQVAGPSPEKNPLKQAFLGKMNYTQHKINISEGKEINILSALEILKNSPYNLFLANDQMHSNTEGEANPILIPAIDNKGSYIQWYEKGYHIQTGPIDMDNVLKVANNVCNRNYSVAFNDCNNLTIDIIKSISNNQEDLNIKASHPNDHFTLSDFFILTKIKKYFPKNIFNTFIDLNPDGDLLNKEDLIPDYIIPIPTFSLPPSKGFKIPSLDEDEKAKTNPLG